MPRRDPVVDHVVLVSVDGFRPEFCMDETWPAPTLQELCWEGAYAHGVRGVFPSLTYPAHTTMVTGALPARHGIYFNEPFEPAGQTRRWYWEASAIRVPTLWDAVRAAGLTSAAVSWPVTVGAAIDWNVPEIWPLSDRIDAMEPIRQATMPERLFEEVEREAVGRLREANFSIRRLAREDRLGAIAGYLLERYRPALLLVHLIAIDHIQHQLGLSNPEVRRAVGAADRAIGQILEVIERLGLRDRTAFAITGDHGEVDIHTELRPNVLLVDAGLMEARPDRGRWRATFHATGGAAFLRLRDAGDEEAVVAVRRLLDGLRRGERRLFTILERDALDRIGADPEAPFALAARPGITITDAPGGRLVQGARGAGHGYDPHYPEMNTGFVGSGAGFRKGAVAPLLPLENIAPLVATLLGLDFDAPDGVLNPGLLAL
ncbi:MAG: alkaline phosphatase family protein [Gemmatimonadetes bacterium]|nr:alkaline phosphatase family protein [Gemmatimonadota bacterium]